MKLLQRMSECDLARCQQDRKIIRREFNKWTKNILLQIGLETISKNHLEFDINSFNDTNDEQIPVDFNPNQTCLFCLNRQEYFSIKKIHHNKTNICVNEDTEPIINDEENSPLDLSLKSTSNLNSRSFDMQSDILPIYNPEEFLLSSHMNLDYLSQSFPNMNLFSSLPINQQYQFNSSSFLKNDYVTQLAKQMAYLRMIQEIENQRNNKKSKVLTNGSAQSSSSSILTESMHVNQIINDIMIRTLNEIFEEQTKQQTRVSKQGELLFVKKQNQNNDDITILNTKKHQHNNQLNPSSSNSSSTSSVSSRCSPSVFTKTKSQSKQSSSHTPRRRPREIIPNSKIIVAMDGKQIRPKRGQYRRYESEQLAKAVAAVLSNEMSVHKAGSYFGVPHSTLEYKVKERNSKMPITTKNNNELSPSISSMPINDDNNNISRTKSMEYDDGDDNDQLLLGKNNSTNEDHHEMNDEEIQLYIPIELETN